MCTLDHDHGRHAPPPVATAASASDQLARYIGKHGLPGKIQAIDVEMLQYNEVVVVVDQRSDLDAWVKATRPFQIAVLEGVHEHGAAIPISDAVQYVVVRANGADGVIGGQAEGDFSPAADGWSLWVRFYPQGRTIFEKPPGDRDIAPGRQNNLLIPVRKGLPPATGSTLPHQQLTELAPRELCVAMRQWMDTQFPLVRTGPSLVSDHVTWAMHLEGAPLAPHARVLAPLPGATEFAHMHVDGSWHLSLPAEDRWEVLVKGWGVIHPVAKFGVNAIMFFSPRTEEEVRHVKEAVMVSYRYALGEVH